MRANLCLIVSLLVGFCSVPAGADILVWRGAGALQEANGVRSLSRTRTVNLVVESDNLSAVLVVATAAARTVEALGTFALGYAEIGTAPRQIYLSTASTGYTNPDNFRSFFLRMNGKKARLSTLPVGQNTVDLPRSLVVFYSDLAANAGTPGVFNGKFSLAYHQADTFEFNGQNLDLSSAVNAVIGRFVARGFQDITRR